MRHVAAYLLAAMGGSQPNSNTIKTILDSVGVEADEKQLAVLLEKMEGKDVASVMAQGAALMSSMPAAAGAASGPVAAGQDSAPAAEEKKEEKKEEPEEESDDDMGFGLFD